MMPELTVFIVDDDLDDHEIFLMATKEISAGIHCVFASDGVDALEKIHACTSFVPNFILVDINMPRMNGIKCLVELKKIPRLANVPVYMYSTSAAPAIVEECKKLGAVNFIKKYIDINDLKQELFNIIYP